MSDDELLQEPLSDDEFLKAVDSVLFYSYKVGGCGVSLLHREDFDRYKRVLPKERKRPYSYDNPEDEDEDFYSLHPIERFRNRAFEDRHCAASPHTSRGQVRSGLSSVSALNIYVPKGEVFTISEYAKRLDAVLAESTPLWEAVTMTSEDFEFYRSGAGGDRFLPALKSHRREDNGLIGKLSFGKDKWDYPIERKVYLQPWVTPGTVVTGTFNYDQKTHTLYMWSTPPIPGTRYDRDIL